MKPFRTLAMILFAVALASCGKETEIQSDLDHSADFPSYKTFGYATPLGTEVDGYSDEITQSFKAATRRELESRGYQFVDADPDLLVNFGALLEKKGQSPVAADTHHVAYYGYRRAAVYKAWPSYMYERNGEKYTQGTLNVDLVDAKRQQLVWEGVAIGRVKDESLSNPGPGIDKVVREIFAKYTYRAGG